MEQKAMAVAGVCSCNHENSNLDSPKEISLVIQVVAGANSCNGITTHQTLAILKRPGSFFFKVVSGLSNSHPRSAIF